jgi:hypothetical protein
MATARFEPHEMPSGDVKIVLATERGRYGFIVKGDNPSKVAAVANALKYNDVLDDIERHGAASRYKSQLYMRFAYVAGIIDDSHGMIDANKLSQLSETR